MTCIVCPDYTDDVNLRIERAGRAHHDSMRAIRSVEAEGYGRAVAMGHTIGVGSQLEAEAEQTAEALNF